MKRFLRKARSHGLSTAIEAIPRAIASRTRVAVEYARWSRVQSQYDVDLAFSDVAQRFHNPNDVHAYMHHYFHHRCPAFIREHRKYFRKGGRGFGEDAFHAMWWLLFLEEQPARMLEIGVYRGQVISLWALIAKYMHRGAEVHGISPFAPVGDAVSEYMSGVDFLEDTRRAFRRFLLPDPTLVRALSTDPAAVHHVSRHRWDLIYLDGSHDFETVLADYRLSKAHLRTGGILVMDDAAAGTKFRPPSFSFAGHEGPSLVAREFAMREMRLLSFVGHNAIFRKEN